MFSGFGLDLWPRKVIWGQQNLYHLKVHIWLPIWLLRTTSLYHVPFSRFSNSKFLGFGHDLWPMKIIWGQNFLYHSKAHIWLPIWLLWTTSLYLVPFSRYSTSKFSRFDVDLGPLNVIWGQESHTFYWQHLSISYRFRDIRLQHFLGLTSTFDPWRSPEVNKIYTIRKPLYDFLFDFFGQNLSFSNRFRDIGLQRFLGFDLDLWPLEVIWGQKFLYNS